MKYYYGRFYGRGEVLIVEGDFDSTRIDGILKLTKAKREKAIAALDEDDTVSPIEAKVITCDDIKRYMDTGHCAIEEEEFMLGVGDTNEEARMEYLRAEDNILPEWPGVLDRNARQQSPAEGDDEV